MEKSLIRLLDYDLMLASMPNLGFISSHKSKWTYNQAYSAGVFLKGKDILSLFKDLQSLHSHDRYNFHGM